MKYYKVVSTIDGERVSAIAWIFDRLKTTYVPGEWTSPSKELRKIKQPLMAYPCFELAEMYLQKNTHALRDPEIWECRATRDLKTPDFIEGMQGVVNFLTGFANSSRDSRDSAWWLPNTVFAKRIMLTKSCL